MAVVLDNLVEKLRAFKRDLPALALEVLEENKTFAEDLNIAQLSEGQRVDGAFLPDYSPASVYGYGKPPGPIRLFDTGAFYRGITATVTREYFDLVGQDEKTAMLESKYGDVTGLTEESKRVFIEDTLRPQIERKTREYLLQQ